MKKFGRNVVLLLGLLIGVISLMSIYSESTNQVLQKLRIQGQSEVHLSGIDKSLELKNLDDVSGFDHK